MKRIGVGTKFHYNHADSNPLWQVIEARGQGTWIAKVIESPDWNGTHKAFSTEEIKAAIQMDEYWKMSVDASNDFYKSLVPGAIVHYCNGFNQYVRCKVTEDHKLLPIAMVGDWLPHDLPHRYPNGKIYQPYHLKNITEGKTFCPHASNVYEYQHLPDAKDPRQMTPINLEVPPMTPAEEANAAKHRKLDCIRAMLNDNEIDPDTIFEEVKKLLLSD